MVFVGISIRLMLGNTLLGTWVPGPNSSKRVARKKSKLGRLWFCCAFRSPGLGLVLSCFHVSCVGRRFCVLVFRV